MPGHGRWQVEHVLYVLLSRDGRTGGDAPDQRNSRSLFLHVGDGDFDANDLLRGVRRGGDSQLGARAISEIERAREPWLANKESVGLKRVEMMLHRRR